MVVRHDGDIVRALARGIPRRKRVCCLLCFAVGTQRQRKDTTIRTFHVEYVLKKCDFGFPVEEAAPPRCDPIGKLVVDVVVGTEFSLKDNPLERWGGVDGEFEGERGREEGVVSHRDSQVVVCVVECQCGRREGGREGSEGVEERVAVVESVTHALRICSAVFLGRERVCERERERERQKEREREIEMKEKIEKRVR